MEWIEKGGVFLWPILICSLVALAVIGERAYVFWKNRMDYPAFLQRLRRDLKLCPLHRPDWLARECCPVCRMAAIYFEYIKDPAPLRERAIKREGDRLIQQLEKGTKLLSSIAQVTPLLGLLGTVYGLVIAFFAMEQAGGQVRVADMAGGIWEALLTTVAGLLVGIPAMLAYHYFHAQAETTARRMSQVVSELDELLLRYSNRDRTGESYLPDFEEAANENPEGNLYVG